VWLTTRAIMQFWTGSAQRSRRQDEASRKAVDAHRCPLIDMEPFAYQNKEGLCCTCAGRTN
jgi:hypothetical protein